VQKLKISAHITKIIFFIVLPSKKMSYNELGYTTLSVAEPLEEALASARLLA